MPAGSHQEILRLDIAMEDVLQMDIFHPGNQLVSGKEGVVLSENFQPR